jgi:hypothetical protein
LIATSVDDFDREAVRGRYTGLMGHQDPVLLGRDLVGRVTAVGEGADISSSRSPHTGYTAMFAAPCPSTRLAMRSIPVVPTLTVVSSSYGDQLVLCRTVDNDPDLK